ncbi:hypothetical protein [Laspinema olomoucense]|uniref:hypothetical protein n=1 Tax=Laspinema olomoucense TaxID=3231600 RepID=UPI0021BA6F7B|nr:hypothetical protein [Laspinema sp. D3d]
MSTSGAATATIWIWETLKALTWLQCILCGWDATQRDRHQQPSEVGKECHDCTQLSSGLR